MNELIKLLKDAFRDNNIIVDDDVVSSIAIRIQKARIFGEVLAADDLNSLPIEPNTWAYFQKVCCQCNIQQNDLNFLTRLLRFPKTLKVVGKIAKENKGIEPNILIEKISKYITDNNISPYRQRKTK